MQLLVLADQLTLALEEVGVLVLEVDFLFDLLVGLRIYVLLHSSDLELKQFCSFGGVFDQLLLLFLQVVELELGFLVLVGEGLVFLL